MMNTEIKTNIKQTLDKLVETYENPDFVKDDPIQFIHRFKDKKDIEIAGFISSCFAFGKRELFIKKLNDFFEIAEEKPLKYVLEGDFSKLKDFNYRFIKPNDMMEMMRILRELYAKDGGLEKLFEYAYKNGKINFQIITDYFYSHVKNPVGQGFYFMIPNPSKGGAMKRMNMYLRWMVRKSVVDFGIWTFMKPSELLIPLDVHVARISRELGLLTRKANDFKSVIEITEHLKSFCPEDPIKYDFAMFGYGVNNK